ncbi:MAG: trimethylamine methyltransferase family protein [Desulfovermiculus sp.]|nr:trimethylamine methyltransferase family protein [Desulfovermiculus sp.]
MGTRTNLNEEQYVQFAFLSEGQKRLIYSEALEILQYTGVKIYHPAARDVLAKHGCTVDGHRVFIPSQLVRRTLAWIPPVTTIHHWNHSGKLRVELDRTYFGPGPTCPNFIDPRTKERRKYLRQDAADVARVCDALSGIDFVMSLGMISDVTEGLEEVYEFAEMIQNSPKPIIAWCHSKENCRIIHEIAAVMAGSKEQLQHRPNYIFYNEPISPLSCDFSALDKLMYCAEQGIPQIFAPTNMGGATVPATHAAHLVVTLAESLTGTVISQLVQPGACIIIGGTQSILDMRHTTFAYGAPELSILSAGLAEMAEYIGLPVFTAAGCSDSKLEDIQAAVEATLSIHSAMLSGATLVHDVGFVESGMTGSLSQLVLSDEIISRARHIVKGVFVTEESMAEEVIHAVGPGGDFRNQEHTHKWKSLRWNSRLGDEYMPEGPAGEKQEMQTRIAKKLLWILETHQGPAGSITQDTQDAVQRILELREEEMAKGQRETERPPE